MSLPYIWELFLHVTTQSHVVYNNHVSLTCSCLKAFRNGECSAPTLWQTHGLWPKKQGQKQELVSKSSLFGEFRERDNRTVIWSYIKTQLWPQFCSHNLGKPNHHRYSNWPQIVGTWSMTSTFPHFHFLILASKSGSIRESQIYFLNESHRTPDLSLAHLQFTQNEIQQSGHNRNGPFPLLFFFL